MGRYAFGQRYWRNLSKFGESSLCFSVSVEHLDLLGWKNGDKKLSSVYKGMLIYSDTKTEEETVELLSNLDQYSVDQVLIERIAELEHNNDLLRDTSNAVGNNSALELEEKNAELEKQLVINQKLIEQVEQQGSELEDMRKVLQELTKVIEVLKR